MYKDIVTVFNRKIDDSGDYWYPTVLHNVHVNTDRAAILAKYGESAQDTAMINIRYHLRDNEKMVGEKVWLPPKEWARQEDAAEYITFKSGDVFDFIYVGEWTDESPINNRDYSDVGGFYNLMNKEHDFVFAISSVGGPYTVIPHFEILCR